MAQRQRELGMTMACAPRMSDDELAMMNELLAAELGVHFPDHKREILESRLAPRLVELQLRSYLEYYVLLQHDCGNGRQETRHLAELVTNNESYFFRETYQFEALFEHALPEMKARAGAPQKLRFLSAGCSSGEEPYTLSICARENQFRMFGYDAVIDAFDVDPSRIAIAESGLYAPMSLRGLTAEKIEKYFTSEGESFRLKPGYRAGTRFHVGNLLRAEAYGAPGTYDAIFCRNVLIYFTEATIAAAIDRFHRALRDGGLLFLGHSESIIGLSAAFEPERIGNCIAYRRNPSYRSP